MVVKKTWLCIKLAQFLKLQDICSRTEGDCGHTEDTRLILDIISIIGVILSGIGLILTIITLLIFEYAAVSCIEIFSNHMIIVFVFAGSFGNEMPQSFTYS